VDEYIWCFGYLFQSVILAVEDVNTAFTDKLLVVRAGETNRDKVGYGEYSGVNEQVLTSLTKSAT
jgi:hypothetical protein